MQPDLQLIQQASNSKAIGRSRAQAKTSDRLKRVIHPEGAQQMRPMFKPNWMESRDDKRARRASMLQGLKVLEKRVEDERASAELLALSCEKIQAVCYPDLEKLREQSSKDQFHRRSIGKVNSRDELEKKISKLHHPRIDSEMVKHREFSQGKQSFGRYYPDGSDGCYRIKIGQF